jgi:peptidoglycan lytic transglycosylase G
MRRGLVAGALALVVLLLIAAAGSAAWLVFRDERLPATPVDVIVPEGSSVSDIALLLASRQVVSRALLLSLYVRVHGGGDRIEAAEYTFPAHETIAQVALRLAAGGKPPTVWLTVPEGYTAAQIGRKLDAAGLVSEASFARAVRSTTLLFAGALTSGLEGYLFPDTYEIPRKTTADDVARVMTQEFRAKLPRDYVAASRRLRMTVPQIVTVASMIEREAKVDVERPVIASVIYNRLRLGMPLEIDATIEYALPHHKAALSFGDLKIDSPYNTYAHAGLPPTPISNPGKASLDAAFHPATTPFLYYVYKGSGRHEFSQTLQQQQENERRYLR